MKKLKITLILLVSVFVLSGVVSAASFTTPANDQAKDNGQPGNSPVIDENWELSPRPYYISSENSVLKALLGVRHEFPGAFSAKLNSSQIQMLNLLGIETEPVALFHVLARPSCGDGKCQGFENPLNCPEDCGGSECSPDNQYPWGIVKVGGGSGGNGMTVAVLDTGIDQNHPDFINNTIDCQAFGYSTCEDGYGHGTHVAGTILANGKIVGVAPATNLIVVKVCNDTGSCPGDNIASGIHYAVENGADIISMSIGGDYPDSQIRTAIEYAVGEGLLVVAAAGNDGPAEGSIDYPSAYPQVVAVTAIDSNENVASWSSKGINDGDDTIISEGEVELAGPGASVESSYNNGCYAYMSGTSMATPHISGLAAKLWQGTASTTRQYLRTIAKDIDIPGYDIASGYGLPIAPNCALDTDCSLGELCCSGQCRTATCSVNIDCNDNNACTIDVCTNPNTCLAVCSYADVIQCANSDGCCPAGCDSSNDNDCSVSACGNGICEGINFGENCFSCPSDCGGTGKDNARSCCGDGKCQNEKATSCPIDCL